MAKMATPVPGLDQKADYRRDLKEGSSAARASDEPAKDLAFSLLQPVEEEEEPGVVDAAVVKENMVAGGDTAIEIGGEVEGVYLLPLLYYTETA